MNAIFQICNENTKGGSTMFYDDDTAMKGFAIKCKVSLYFNVSIYVRYLLLGVHVFEKKRRVYTRYLFNLVVET